jgi:hypothetical protein
MEILHEQKIPFVSLTHRYRNEISVMINDTGRQKFQLRGMVCILRAFHAPGICVLLDLALTFSPSCSGNVGTEINLSL